MHIKFPMTVRWPSLSPITSDFILPGGTSAPGMLITDDLKHCCSETVAVEVNQGAACRSVL